MRRAILIHPLAVATAIGFGFQQIADAIPATIVLKNQLVLETELVRKDNQQVYFKVRAGDAATESVPINRIAFVEFAKTPAWESAAAAKRNGQLDVALEQFKQIAAAKGAHFHPLPGNLSSLAQLEILDCHRLRFDPKLILAQKKIVDRESQNLPPNRRELSAVIGAWVALAEGRYEAVNTFVEEHPEELLEGPYILGLAHLAQEQKREAFDAFTTAYTLGYGADQGIAKAALRRCIELLVEIDDEERRPELQAQLKIYRELYGRGELWEGAAPDLVALAEAEMETIGQTKPNEAEEENPESEGETENAMQE